MGNEYEILEKPSCLFSEELLLIVQEDDELSLWPSEL